MEPHTIPQAEGQFHDLTVGNPAYAGGTPVASHGPAQGSGDVYVPAVGDCYDVRPVDKAPPIYLKLDCALPHQNEVFAILEYTAGKEYPGPDTLETQAKNECPKSWAAYVGAPYETSRFELAYNLPDQAGWGNGIRHVIGCLVVDPQGELITGSVRGSGK